MTDGRALQLACIQSQLLIIVCTWKKSTRKLPHSDNKVSQLCNMHITPISNLFILRVGKLFL